MGRDCAAGYITTSMQHRLMKWTQSLKETFFGGLVNDMTKNKGELIAKNALLRQQLIIVRRQVKPRSYKN
jgi:putative transposase